MVVITMKYLQRDQNNRFRYRRGIPKHVRVLFNGRSEFVKVLAKTEEEALQLYPKIHAHFEKQLKSALTLVPKKPKLKILIPISSPRHSRIWGFIELLPGIRTLT